MTKHIYIDEYGTFLGKTSARLTISQGGQLQKEIALSRIKSINILKGGIALSSDLIEACSLRGIKLFFLDFKNIAHTSLSSTASHAVANVRRAQFLTIESDEAKEIARALILGKTQKPTHNTSILSQIPQNHRQREHKISKRYRKNQTNKPKPQNH